MLIDKWVNPFSLVFGKKINRLYLSKKIILFGEFSYGQMLKKYLALWCHHGAL